MKLLPLILILLLCCGTVYGSEFKTEDAIEYCDGIYKGKDGQILKNFGYCYRWVYPPSKRTIADIEPEKENNDHQFPFPTKSKRQYYKDKCDLFLDGVDKISISDDDSRTLATIATAYCTRALLEDK